MARNKSRSELFWIYALPVLLSLVGLAFVFEASSVRGFSETGNSFYYALLQARWIGLGIISMIAFSLIDYHKLYYLSIFFMGGTIFLLFLVLIPGIGQQIGGARRWIDLGFFNLQPTELAKMSTIIYLSSWFIHRERKRFFSFLILLGLLMFLIFLQPDMGTAIITFCLSIAIYFLAGIELYYLWLLLPVSVVGFFLMIKITPYRFQRLMAFFDPNLDPLGITYHIKQILVSLSNGGIFGQGYGASRQKFLFLPEAHTDSIFAIIGEEIGFFGAAMLIFFFLLISLKMYRVVENAPDRFGRLLAGGIFSLFNLQLILNLSSMVNLTPLTGVPLPFVSYGGSHLLVLFALIGIMASIARRIKTL